MFCPKCGTNNADGAGFCAGCGSPLTPAVNPVQAAVPVAPAPAPVYTPQPAPQPAPVYNQTPITPVPPQTRGTNALCVAGFITSLVSVVLAGTTALISLILSIIGFNAAKKNNQGGKGLGLAGIIISAVLMALFVLGICLGIYDVNKYSKKYDEPIRRTTEYEETTRRTTRETTEATTEETTRETPAETPAETSADTSATESKNGLYLTSVGNDKTGKVPLNTGKWLTFKEAGGFSSEFIEHEQAKDISTGAIIGLYVVDVAQDAETLAKAQMAEMEKSGATKVTGARVKIGGYDAIQCYGTYPDNTILVVWHFRGDDGLMRRITVEFPSNNSSAFHTVEDGYKLDR